MKFVDRPDRQIEVGGGGETAEMSIKADARAFRNLVDNIYSEKEKTVARELIANALDSHAAAGIPDREVVVSLPTVLEPTFSVRDFGGGMSHDFVMNHYRVLFESTKQDDNDQTGMFGVGSKSPLALTDTFTVRCFDPPVGAEPARCRLYEIHVPAKGVPTIRHTFNSELDDPWNEDHRGVEIIVPISREHRPGLLKGLGDQHFFWFDKAVRFEGDIDELNKQCFSSIIALTDGVYFAPARAATAEYGYRYRSYSSWNVVARQGAAVYPLVEDQIVSLIPTDIVDIIRNLCASERTLMVDLPIGTADVTLARESIQYGTETCENIAKIMTGLFKDFGEKVNSYIDDEHSVPRAVDTLASKLGAEETHGKWGSKLLASSLIPFVLPKLKTNFEEWIKQYTEAQLEANPYLNNAPSRTVAVGKEDMPDGKISLYSAKFYSEDNDTLWIDIDSTTSSLTVKYPCVFYVLPTQLPQWQDKIKAHAREEFADDALTLGPGRRAGLPVYIIRCAKRNITDAVAALKRINVYSGHHYTVADLPGGDDAVKEIRTRNYSKTSAYPSTGGGFSETKVEPNYVIPAYYVIRCGISCDVTLASMDDVSQRRVTRMSNYRFHEVLKKARSLGMFPDSIPVYRVTENQARKIAKTAPDWVHIGDAMYAGTRSLVKDTVGLVEIHQSNLARSFGGYGVDSFFKSVLSVSDRSPEKISALASLSRLIKADPIFRVVAAVKVSQLSDKSKPARTDSTLNDLVTDLHLAGEASDADRTDRFGKLTMEYERRYSFLTNFLNQGYSGPDALAVKHLDVYADGLIAKIVPEPHAIPQQTFDDLEPLSAELDQKLREVENSLVVEDVSNVA